MLSTGVSGVYVVLSTSDCILMVQNIYLLYVLTWWDLVKLFAMSLFSSSSVFSFLAAS